MRKRRKVYKTKNANIKTFILTVLNIWAGTVDCIYLYVGLKAGVNSCKWKISEQLKKCIMLKLNSIGKMKNTHIVRVLK